VGALEQALREQPHHLGVDIQHMLAVALQRPDWGGCASMPTVCGSQIGRDSSTVVSLPTSLVTPIPPRPAAP
jgi:hypothetical protein